MDRDRSDSDYSESMNDATTCSCTNSTIDKCSLRSCGMFHEPFFLHPPGTRPRDGIYINPMSPFIAEPAQKPRDTGESFYLHSPHDLVYTRIAHLFCDTDKTRNGERGGNERKDETLTVKVDVHINNGNYNPICNGNSMRSDSIKDTGSTGTEHAYEQICIRPDENGSVHSSTNKKINDDASEIGRSRTVARRFSRSSSGSESSNMSSELQCYSSTTSTPSRSRNSSNERPGKIPRPPTEPLPTTAERKTPPVNATLETDRETNGPITGPSIVKPPPPPPPPPPPDVAEDASSGPKLNDFSTRDEKKDKDTRSETGSTASSAANKSDVSSEQHPEVRATASTSSDTEDVKSNQVAHLVNKHMVLPFIPPKFTDAADSNTLLKPSEYLRSICKNATKNSLSKARSVDNLDIQCRPDDGDDNEERAKSISREEVKALTPGPPPPPLPPVASVKDCPAGSANHHETETSKNPQPLATISIHDLTSVQLRRTNVKMHATKTFSAPPPRSVSMTNVSEPFFVQKTDLIAELKKTKDIPGIKKLKVERAKVEKTQEQNMITEISKAFSVSNFVEQIPEKDSSGNVIPIWKRQMLARKAAERAKKELEEQIARENEEKRQQAIPPWKRQLLKKKDGDEKKPTGNSSPTVSVIVPPAVKIEIATIAKRDASPAAIARIKVIEIEKPETEEKPTTTTTTTMTATATTATATTTTAMASTTRDDRDDEDDAPIIPWRAQLRKTNSKLNIID